MKNPIQKRGMAILLLMTLFSLSMSTEAFAQKKKKNKDNVVESQQTVQQDYGQTITLVTSATGATKEEATTNALRSAIEQAFGTFVSANTSVVNDDLVKDEIVTVTSGNIKSFKEINNRMISGDLLEVTVQAVVSIDNLIRFAQSHGMSAELAGQTFAMNIKIAELNKQNESTALRNLIIQLYDIAKLGLYDFSIHLEQPKMKEDHITGISCAVVEGYVVPTPNDNYKAYVELAKKTLFSLNMSRTEVENLVSLGMGAYGCTWKEQVISEKTGGILGENFIKKGDEIPRYYYESEMSRDKYNIILRNDINKFHENHKNEVFELSNGANFIYYYERFKYLSKFAYGIQDNIGNRIEPKVNLDEVVYSGRLYDVKGKRMRRLGTPKEYQSGFFEEKVEAQVINGKFIKDRTDYKPFRYWVNSSYAGFDEISGYVNFNYSLSDISKLTKIDVFPVQINLLDNEILMSVIKSTADPNKVIEELNKLIALIKEGTTHSEKMLRYLNMADDLCKLLLLMVPEGDAKNAITATMIQVEKEADSIRL